MQKFLGFMGVLPKGAKVGKLLFGAKIKKPLRNIWRSVAQDTSNFPEMERLFAKELARQIAASAFKRKYGLKNREIKLS